MSSNSSQQSKKKGVRKLNIKKKKKLTVSKKNPVISLRDTIETLDSNNSPVLFDSSFEERYSGVSMEKSDDKYWVLPDKTKFPKFIFSNEEDNFSQNISSEDNIRKPLKIWSNKTSQFKNISPFKHQKFVSDYLSDNSPYRGLLLYHGLGSGKSGASIMTAEGYRQRKIVVLLPKSLRQNYEDEIQTFGDIAYRKEYHWCFIPVNTKGSDKMQVYELFESKGISRYQLDNFLTKRKSPSQTGIWMVDQTKDSPNYNSLNDNERAEIDTQILKMYNNKYIFVHYNAGKWTLPSVFNQLSPRDYNIVKNELFGEIISDTDLTKNQMSKIVNEFTSNKDIDNPFDNKVIIIDEVHNLGSLMAGGGFTGPHLYQLLVTAKNSKIVMLSGTPVINIGYELALIFNILKGTIRSWKIKLHSERWNHDELEKILNSNPMINRVIINSSHKTIEFTRNPYGFGAIYDERSNNKNGIKKHADFDVSDSTLLENILSELQTKNYTIAEDSNVSFNEYKLFPDSFRKQQGKYRYISKLREQSENIFNDYYIDYNTFEVKNKMSFKTRILGLVSFYNEISGNDPVTGYKLFPDKEYASPEETEVFMSDYQFMIYSIGREIERELELKSKKSTYNQSSEIMNQSKNKTPNLFRVLSRQSGIAVFPPGSSRPRPKDFKYDKAEQELRNIYLVHKKEIKNLLLEICSDKENDELIEDFISQLKLDEQSSSNIYNKVNTFKKMFKIEEDRLDSEDVKSTVTEIISNGCQFLEEKDPDELNYIEACMHAIDQINPDHFKIDGNISNNLSTISPKYKKIVHNISKSPGLVFCYSQFRSVEGIEIFSRVLLANGYRNLNNIIKEELEFGGQTSEDVLTQGRVVRVLFNKEQSEWKSAKISKVVSENNFMLDFFDKKDCNVPSDCDEVGSLCINSKCASPNDIIGDDKKIYHRDEIYPAYFALWTGTESVEERSKVQEVFNNYDNRYGQSCLILLATASGAEGISLMNVRQVHIMEPYWNNVRIDQVIGRARRIKSHVNLLPHQQNVRIFQYVIKFSPDQISGSWGSYLNNSEFIDYENKRSDKIRNLVERLLQHVEDFITVINSHKNIIDPIRPGITNEDLVELASSLTDEFKDPMIFNNEEYLLTSDNKTDLIKLIGKIHRINDNIIKSYADAEKIGEKYIPNWDSLKASEITTRKNNIIQRLTQQINTLDNGMTSDQVLEDISNKKTKILYDFLHQLKEAAVDCVFNKNDNVRSNPENSNINCVNTIPVKGEYTFELSDELSSTDAKMLELSVTRDIEHEYIITLNSKKFGKFKILVFTPKEYDDYRVYLREVGSLEIFNYYSYYNLIHNLPDISGRKDSIGTLTITPSGSLQPILKKEFTSNLMFYTQIQNIIESSASIPDQPDALHMWTNHIKSSHKNMFSKKVVKTKESESTGSVASTWKCLICNPNKELSMDINVCPIHPFFTQEIYNKTLKSQDKLRK